MSATVASNSGVGKARAAPAPSTTSTPPPVDNDIVMNGPSSTSQPTDSSAGSNIPTSHSLDADVEMKEFTEVASKKKSTSSTKPNPAPSSNPRMIVLDFLPNVVQPARRVVQTLRQHTEYANSVTVCNLERGGVSILFRNKGQRNHAAGILQEHLNDILLPKETWMNKKEKFEVAIWRFPISKDVGKLKTLQGVLDIKVHYKTIGTRQVISQVILFCENLETASKYIEEGIFFDDDFYAVSPWVWRPRVSFSQCGSLDHASCERHVCLRCGSQHDPQSSDCEVQTVCGRCKSTEHNSWKCPDYVQKVSAAHAAKKKSYLEALGIKKKPSKPPQPKSAPKESKSPGASRYTTLATSPLLPDIVLTCLKVLASVLNLDIKDKLPAIAEQTVNLLTKQASKPTVSTETSIVNSQVTNSQDNTEDLSDSDSGMSFTEDLEPRRNDQRKRRVPDSVEELSISSRASQSKSKTFKANCACGLQYNPNPGWRNHLASCPEEEPYVTCWCGSHVVRSKDRERPAKWNAFNIHIGRCTGHAPIPPHD
jgi:hypothetical protein